MKFKGLSAKCFLLALFRKLCQLSGTISFVNIKLKNPFSIVADTKSTFGYIQTEDPVKVVRRIPPSNKMDAATPSTGERDPGAVNDNGVQDSAPEDAAVKEEAGSPSTSEGSAPEKESLGPLKRKAEVDHAVTPKKIFENDDMILPELDDAADLVRQFEEARREQGETMNRLHVAKTAWGDLIAKWERKSTETILKCEKAKQRWEASTAALAAKELEIIRVDEQKKELLDRIKELEADQKARGGAST